MGVWSCFDVVLMREYGLILAIMEYDHVDNEGVWCYADDERVVMLMMRECCHVDEAACSCFDE